MFRRDGSEKIDLFTLFQTFSGSLNCEFWMGRDVRHFLNLTETAQKLLPIIHWEGPMSQEIDQQHDQFVKTLMGVGILSYNEQEKLWDIAKRCAGTVGISMAGVGLVAGSTAGTITLPVIGTISGALAGTLAGLAGGTISCVMLNVSERNALRRLAAQQ